MANQFRDHYMRKQYDLIVKAYNDKHRDLFAKNGSQKMGSSIATYFWRGFNQVKINWTPDSRRWLAYAIWRAGQDQGKDWRRKVMKENKCEFCKIEKDRKKAGKRHQKMCWACGNEI